MGHMSGESLVVNSVSYGLISSIFSPLVGPEVVMSTASLYANGFVGASGNKYFWRYTDASEADTPTSPWAIRLRRIYLTSPTDLWRR